jgi:hypothetical protein
MTGAFITGLSILCLKQLRRGTGLREMRRKEKQIVDRHEMISILTTRRGTLFTSIAPRAEGK